MKNTLIICPFSFKNELLNKYRKEAFSNVKCVSKEELLNDKFGHYGKAAVAYLMINKNYTYEQARTILKYARFVNKDYSEEKLHYLYELNKELKEKKLLIDNPYYSNLFNNKEVHVYGYSSHDEELKRCLEGVEFDYNLEKELKGNNTIDQYQTLDDEIYGMLNNIAGLIDEGIDSKNIFILTNDELILYYIEKYSHSFNLFINFLDSDDVLTTGTAADFIKKYKETKDLDEAINYIENLDSPLSDALVELIKENVFEEFSFEQQLDYLKNIFKKQVIMPPKYRNGVTVIGKPIYKKDAYIFVPNFVQGVYPVTFKDNEYLSDKLIKLVGLNTSIDKAMMFEDEMISFFASYNHFYFSSSSHSFKDVYYESPWISKLNIKVRKASLPENIYSETMANFNFGKAMDLKTFYSEETKEYLSLVKYYNKDIYRSFDNKYTGIKAYDFTMDLTHSYSAIKNYCMCPFMYCLYKAFELDQMEQTFPMKRGSLGHAVLEECFNENFDFEESFERHKNETTWSSKDEVFLEKFKVQLKVAVEACQKHFNSYMASIQKPLTEQKLCINIDSNTKLYGIIDKCVLLKDNNIIVVDYKTGSESFNPKHLEEGYSLQLPTYAYLLHNSIQFCQYNIAGLYINPTMDSSLKTSIDEDDFIPGYLKLSGITIADKDTIGLIDSTIVDGEAKFLASVKINKDGGFSKSSKVASKEELERFEKIAQSIYENANKQIRENNFDISPSFISGYDNACVNCPFKDICYVTKEDRRYVSDDEEEEEE